MKQWLRDNRGFVVFLLSLGLLRSAVADWNPVPTGSMRPTIQEGDVVLVNRLAYDLKLPFTHISLRRLGEPQRGDVVTFDSPNDGTRLIKRVVALPGDEIGMRDGHLLINGQEAQYQTVAQVNEPLMQRTVVAQRVVETLPQPQTKSKDKAATSYTIQWLEGFAPPSRHFDPVKVPADAYVVLGDNRDNSADSRYIGFIPRSHLIGQAHHVLLSADILDYWQPRLERFGMKL